jgi:rsbT co-antagonist protein RsbR
MSTPIIEVWDGVLTLPILGLVDSVRTAEIMDGLLQAVTRVRARFAILDMTGVDVIDTSTAGHLLGLIRAIRLLGAEGIITGIHPNIAQTMVSLDVDLSNIKVHANLREALKYCIARARPR